MNNTRPVNIADWKVRITKQQDGVLRVDPELELGPYPVSLTERLDHWAAETPDRVFLARREPAGGPWRQLTYREFRSKARGIAQALLGMDLSAERPIVILSGNDLEHALLGMAAMYAGIPYAPVSPAYSLVSQDLAKLRHIYGLLTPGLVFASDATLYDRALAVAPRDAKILTSIENLSSKATSQLPGIDADTVAKILFTSGSTGVPKGVINTHRMLCSNQEMLRTVFRFFADTPPVVCDWLPWNHTFGGNHNFGLVLYNGGTFYIDDGKPAGPAFAETLRNLREVAPTVYFNVPKGYESLVEAMRQDTALRTNFFSRLEMTFYAAASLSQHIWDALDALAVETCGQRIAMFTGLGATETAPFAICVNKETARAGVVGLPVPGLQLKLVPNSEKLEARVKGPNVTPGFWRQPELTRAVFDEEGFYCMGDALRSLDHRMPEKGFVFDGRIAEDFKLSTGTWVSVGPLRARFLQHCGTLVRDVVIAGHDRDEVTALIFPEGTPSRQALQDLLNSFLSQSTGSSTRIARAIVLAEPPSIDGGEITDKGSINQRAVLQRRAHLVEALYALEIDTALVLTAGELPTREQPV